MTLDYIGTTDAFSDAFTLNISQDLANLRTSDGRLFPSTVYGVEVGQDHTEFQKTWLAYIGYIFSGVIILLHWVYVGNGLLYKMDNLIILGQTMYFFTFAQLLVGKVLAQFYFGWVWLHAGFFPNYFEDTVPSGYREIAAPASYKLSCIDANVIRNGGFAFSLLLTFIGAWLLLVVILLVMQKVLKKEEVFSKIRVGTFLLAGIEFLSMSLTFWSVAHLLYKGSSGEVSDSDFYDSSTGLAIATLVLVGVYSLVRTAWSTLGGIYMLKRILIAIVVAASYREEENVAGILAIEIVFTVLRYLVEEPEGTVEKLTILVEFIAIILCYMLMYLTTVSAAVTCVCSLVVFVFLTALAYDLVELYLNSVS